MTERDASARAYSKDYWDLVLGQLAKRRTVRLATALLALLYAVAIYAPFLANDRPLVFSGTNYDDYRGAWRVVRNAAQDLVTKAESGAEGYEAYVTAQAKKTEGLDEVALAAFQAQQPADRAGWLAVDRDSLALRLATMREQLADEHLELLDAVQRAADDTLAASLAGDDESLARSTQALLAGAGEVRETLRPAKYDEPPEAGRSVALVPRTHYPVLDSLGSGEVYFMVLWALVLAFPLWNAVVNRGLLRGDRERIRNARRPKVAVMVLLPALATLGWIGVRGWGQDELQATSLKEALSERTAQAERVVFPFVAYGTAEVHDQEAFRPPTWHASSAIDDQGFYARESAQDEEGRVVHRSPVVVRSGEPERNAPSRHVLGTDSLGRDILGRMIWGGRISLSVGIISTVLLVFIGTIMGALAGYFGGKVDVLISRIIEVFQCFPVFFLILIVVSFVGPSVLNIMLAIGIFRWTGVARLVRGEFIRLRGLDFVVASEALGVRSARTIFRHVLPNALGPVLVAATFAVASGILTESALSFLGFGVQMPIPSWGSLLNESRNAEHWWIQVFPGLAVFVTVILYNLVGEGVRDALDPRLKEG